MVRTCSVVSCSTGYKKQENNIKAIPEVYPVFLLPEKKPDLYKKWLRFLNRKDSEAGSLKKWEPTKYTGICSKHFEPKFLKIGKRTTLKWELNPVPTIYPEGILPSLLPTPSTSRKPPINRNLEVDETVLFKENDILSFTQLKNGSFCLQDYHFICNNDDEVIFYKIDTDEKFNIPYVSECIVIDQDLNVKLFLKGSPLPLPD